MEKIHIILNGASTVVQIVPVLKPSEVLSDEYIARRKAAGAKLPVLEVPVPQDDKKGHGEA